MHSLFNSLNTQYTIATSNEKEHAMSWQKNQVGFDKLSNRLF